MAIKTRIQVRYSYEQPQLGSIVTVPNAVTFPSIVMNKNEPDGLVSAKKCAIRRLSPFYPLVALEDLETEIEANWYYTTNFDLCVADSVPTDPSIVVIFFPAHPHLYFYSECVNPVKKKDVDLLSIIPGF